MESWIPLSLFIYLGVFSSVEGAQLRIDQEPFIDGQTEPMTISCRIDAATLSRMETLYSLSVLRDVSGPTRENKVVIALANNGQKPVLKDTSLTQRVTLTGKADTNNKRDSYIQVVLRSVSCQDTGTYYCKIVYSNALGAAFMPEVHLNITVQSNPSNILMTVSPRREASPYFINETVDFRCTGQVGFPAKSWSWHWKYADSMGEWISYPYTQRIKDDSPTTSSCSSTGGSTLKHIVTVDDDQRIFRCRVDNNDLYSDNFTIFTSTQTTVRPGGVGSPESSSADIGVIVGATLGALAVLAIVIVLVYFLWYRRRNSGENYKTEEEKYPSEVPPENMTPNPSYDSYPQYPSREEPKGFRNKKKGELNPAMDEPRNRHNSSQDDMPSHNYHNTGYAEDGGAMPMGSAV